MFEMLLWGSVIVGGYLALAAFGEKEDHDEIVYGHDDSITYEDKEGYEQMTYDYFNNLTLENQERYFNENLDLQYYKDDLAVGFTNDRYLNARHAQEIARKTGKKFDDINKTY